MAQVAKLIPFVLFFESRVDTNLLGLSAAELFEHARKTGFVDDPRDSGGATMCGITMSTYMQYCRVKGYPTPTIDDLKSICYMTWHDIFKSCYWDKCKADKINSQSIANLLVDWMWHSGNVAIKSLQRLLGVKVDGIVGPKTLSACNEMEPEVLFDNMHVARTVFVRDIVRRRPSQKRYLNGWLRRINNITYDGLLYL